MNPLYSATAGTLRLGTTSKEQPGCSTPVEDCPASEVFGGLPGLVAHAWPNGLELPSERLSTRTIFGRRASFKLVYHELKPIRLVPLGPVFPGGQLNRFTSHDAVVRFTRLR
jgi:hypothetical protein